VIRSGPTATSMVGEFHHGRGGPVLRPEQPEEALDEARKLRGGATERRTRGSLISRACGLQAVRNSGDRHMI
jgi:hypothetical protein